MWIPKKVYKKIGRDYYYHYECPRCQGSMFLERDRDKKPFWNCVSCGMNVYQEETVKKWARKTPNEPTSETEVTAEGQEKDSKTTQ